MIGVANAQIELRTSTMGNRNLASFYRSPPLSNKLKPLVEVLEQSRGSSKIFGMPKGGLGTMYVPVVVFDQIFRHTRLFV